jgi:hypothetical protein
VEQPLNLGAVAGNMTDNLKQLLPHDQAFVFTLSESHRAGGPGSGAWSVRVRPGDGIIIAYHFLQVENLFLTRLLFAVC